MIIDQYYGMMIGQIFVDKQNLMSCDFISLLYLECSDGCSLCKTCQYSVLIGVNRLDKLTFQCVPM